MADCLHNKPVLQNKENTVNIFRFLPFMLLAICLGCVDRTSDRVKPAATSEADEISANASQQRREAYDATADELAVKKKQVEQNLEDELQKLDRKMADLAERIQNAEGKAKDRLQEEWDELEPQRKKARERLDALKQASGAAWEDLKAGAQSAFAELRQGVNRASEHFGDDAEKP
jgi:hypothetical protein